MRQSSKFASILVIILFIFCAGIASAASLKDDRSLEEKTGRPIQEVNHLKLEESAKVIVQDYFNAIIKEPTAGWTPLVAFSLGRVDATDPSEIKVLVSLKYKEGDMELPPVDYSVVLVNDTYQVQKQVCVFDAIPDSPTKGTAQCSKIFSLHENGSLSVPTGK